MLLAHIRRYDRLLLGAVFLLVGLGLLSLYSLKDVSPFPFFERQLLWAGIGIVLMVGASLIDFRIFRTQSAVVI